MRIVIIDDDHDQRELIKENLRREWPRADYADITGREAFDQIVDEGGFDVALIEHQLRWGNGLAVLERISARFPNVPVIMVTATGSEELAVTGMKSGLSDYVVKGSWERLPGAVRRSLEKAELRMRQEKTQERLKVSEERYRVCSELTSDFAYAFDVKSGRLSVQWVTAAFFRITGYVPEELELDRGWTAIIYGDDKPIAQMHYERLLGGDASVSEFRIETKRGQTRWLKDYARPIRERDHGPVTQIHGAAQDYTFVRKAHAQELALAREQAARQQAESLAAALRESEARSRDSAEGWRQFVRKAGADLREPVKSVTTFASLLQMEHSEDLDDRGREHLRRLMEGVGRLQGLLQTWQDAGAAAAKERGS